MADMQRLQSQLEHISDHSSLAADHDTRQTTDRMDREIDELKQRHDSEVT